jgi:hypothetical protein
LIKLEKPTKSNPVSPSITQYHPVKLSKSKNRREANHKPNTHINHSPTHCEQADHGGEALTAEGHFARVQPWPAKGQAGEGF